MEVDGKVSFVYSEHFICLPKANCSEKNRSYCVKTLSNREHLEIVLADLLDMYLCSSNLLLTEREGPSWEILARDARSTMETVRMAKS